MACRDILHNNDEGIKEFLYRFRPKLSQCDLYGLTRDERKKTKFVKGRSVENMVHRWLEYAGAEFAQLPQHFGPIDFQRYTHDIIAYENNKIRYYFDELCWINGSPYVVQVKSNMLNHKENTNLLIQNGLMWGDIFFGEQCEMLFFYPQNRTLSTLGAQLHEIFYPGVHCIDLGYKVNDLKKFVRKNTAQDLHF